MSVTSSSINVEADFEALKQLGAAVNIVLEDAVKAAAERRTEDFSSSCSRNSHERQAAEMASLREQLDLCRLKACQIEVPPPLDQKA